MKSNVEVFRGTYGDDLIPFIPEISKWKRVVVGGAPLRCQHHHLNRPSTINQGAPIVVYKVPAGKGRINLTFLYSGTCARMYGRSFYGRKFEEIKDRDVM